MSSLTHSQAVAAESPKSLCSQGQSELSVGEVGSHAATTEELLARIKFLERTSIIMIHANREVCSGLEALIVRKHRQRQALLRVAIPEGTVMGMMVWRFL